jgi:hydroxyacylglutathione hydrolase
MFAMGCGRLFEGTAAQMHANLQRLSHLPEDTRVYCGHEYTLANARFAVTVEPDNADLAARLKRVEADRERGAVTLPTTIREERATNPFMRARSVDELARLRTMKDSFS